jgi:hypothetical protein
MEKIIFWNKYAFIVSMETLKSCLIYILYWGLKTEILRGNMYLSRPQEESVNP